MNSKLRYEKPLAELIAFGVKDELMISGNSVEFGGGVIPQDNDMYSGLNDKSSYQLP